MKDSVERKARQAFQDALELSAADRPSFLDRVCGSNGEVRERVQRLLRAHDEAGDFLATAPIDSPPAAKIEGPGTIIDRYRLLQEVGVGGFGVVFMAEQTAPVRRKVALKILKLGMNSEQVIARFEAERQALALMDHPNIAKVLDAGTTETGRPYFVMELVKGIPITEYCDQAKLDTRERLALFQQVCRAIQHAHQKGIIHRDVKPSNILVTLHDGQAVPKVIDFGIAKALDQRLTERTLFTEFRQIIGTPEYMAPEQTALGGLDIDTRADIYSLGVLLYELLTGTKPFDLKSALERGYDEMLRTIREVDPPKPSTRVSTLGEDGRTAALNRHTPPRGLGRLLRGDVDWIVMKCMEKERGRRYESADALEKDIHRFLHDQPVLAGAPSAAYRIRKFVRRHRTGSAAAMMVAVALVIGILLWMQGLVDAREEARKARLAETKQRELSAQAVKVGRRAEDARQAAEAAGERAERLRTEAESRALELQRRLHASRTRMAMSALAAGDMEQVERLLAQASPEERGFEWKLIRWLSDRRTEVREIELLDPGSPDRWSNALAISPNTERVAADDVRGSIRIWDVARGGEGTLIRAYPPVLQEKMQIGDRLEPLSPIGTLLFTPDSARIVSFSNGSHPPKVWDARTGEQIAALEGRLGDPVGVDVGPDSEKLVACWREDSAAVFDLRTGKLLAELAPPPRSGESATLYPLRWSPDGRRIYGSVGRRGLFAWNATTGELEAELVPQSKTWVWDMTVVPNGDSVVLLEHDLPDDVRTELDVLSQEHAVRLRNTADGAVVHTLAPAGSVRNELGFGERFAVSADGRFLAFHNGRLEVFGLRSGARTRAVGIGGSGTEGRFVLQRLDFSSDGRSVRIVEHCRRPSRDASPGRLVIRTGVLDLSDPGDAFTIPTSLVHLRDLRFLSEGRELLAIAAATTSPASTAVVHDARTGRFARSLRDRQDLSLSRDERVLAEWGPVRSVVRLLSHPDEREIATIVSPDDEVTAFAVGPDGDRVALGIGTALGARRPIVRMHDGRTGAPLFVLHGLQASPSTLEFSPDGRTLFGVDSRWNGFLWDAEDGRRIRELPTIRFAFSPGGRRLLVRGDLESVIVDVATGEDRVALEGRTDDSNFLAAAFHPDGIRIATAGVGRVTLWDSRLGIELLTLETPGRSWQRAAFDTEGRRLAAVDNHGALSMWELGEPDAALREERRRAGIELRADVLLRRLRLGLLLGEEPRGRLDSLGEAGAEDPEVLALATARNDALSLPDARLLNHAVWERMKTRHGQFEPGIGVRVAEEAVRLSNRADFILNTLGAALLHAGRFREAIEVLDESDRKFVERGRGPHPMNAVFRAVALHGLGRIEESLVELDRAAELRPPGGHPDFEPAISDAERILGELPSPPPGVRAGEAGHGAASLAQAAFREKRYGAVHPLTLAALTDVARAAGGAGNGPAVVRICREAIRRVVEGDRWSTESLDHLHLMLHSLPREAPVEDVPEAAALAALAARHEAETPGSVARLHECVAEWRRERGEYEASAAAERRAIESRRVLGKGAKLASALHRLARDLADLHRVPEAEAALREAVSIYRRVYGERDESLALSLLLLGSLLLEQERREEAVPVIEESLSIRREFERPAGASVASALATLGGAHVGRGAAEPAIPILRECLQIRRGVLEPGHWRIFSAMSLLGEALLLQGEIEEAAPLILDAARGLEPATDRERVRRNALERAARLCEAQERPADAAAWRAKLR